VKHKHIIMIIRTCIHSGKTALPAVFRNATLAPSINFYDYASAALPCLTKGVSARQVSTMNTGS